MRKPTQKVLKYMYVEDHTMVRVEAGLGKRSVLQNLPVQPASLPHGTAPEAPLTFPPPPLPHHPNLSLTNMYLNPIEKI